jgi:hypothetical protein
MTELHTIAALCQRSHEISKEKGWLDNPRPFSAIASLIHSEISEALEDFRNNKGLNEQYYECKYGGEGSTVTTVVDKESFEDLRESPELRKGLKEAKPCGIPIELADVIIRICQWIGTNGFTEEFAKRVKHQEMETKWFERYLKDFEDFSAMAHARTSKAYLAWDDGSPELQFDDDRDSLVINPLADLTDLVFAFCRYNKIDLWAAIDEKEAFNRTRPHKHGGKKI